MKRKRWWILAGVVLVIAVVAVAISRRGPRPTEVQVAKVERQDVQAMVTANGRVEAQKKVDISATIAGQITHLAVEEGDAVKKGQFLLQIDPVNPRAVARSSQAAMLALSRELDSARAERDQAALDFRRTQENHGAQIVSDSDLDTARTRLARAEAAVRAAERRVQQARASFEGAEDNLAKTTVRAPMDGIVTARRVEEGEVAVIGVLNQPGTVLMTISDMSVVEAELEVDETSIPNVTLGQEARIRIDAYPNRTFDGVVTEVGSSPILQSSSGSQVEAIKFKVKVEIKTPPKTIKPGLSVQADIFTGFRSQALVVPIQALIVRDAEPSGKATQEKDEGRKDAEEKPEASRTAVGRREQEGVYLMQDGKAAFRPIETGLLGELSIEVVKGLEGGETVITGPFRALRSLEPGDAVKVEAPKRGEERRR